MTGGMRLAFAVSLTVLLIGVSAATTVVSSPDFTGSNETSLSGTTSVPGDVDCDEQLTVGDALGVLRYVAALPPYPACISMGDLSCNSGADVVDALLILRAVGGLPVSDCPVPQLLFGLGPEADAGEASPLTKAAPVKMLTNWYNRPADLDWMQNWTGYVDKLYAQGFAMHLIVFSNDTEAGSPCGRAYPISGQINGDVARLAQIFAGSVNGPPLYVTLFTEFQTYPCTDNQWLGSEQYYLRLQEKILELRVIIKQNAPNAKVSFGWGGWQVGWDDPAQGAGLSLFPYFQDVMAQMDFQSFQAMDNSTNVNDVRQMTGILGQFGPVMLAHYQPDNGSQATFDNDTSAMLTDSFLTEMVSKGMFAWSFMSDSNIEGSSATYQRIVKAVQRYGITP